MRRRIYYKKTTCGTRTTERAMGQIDGSYAGLHALRASLTILEPSAYLSADKAGAASTSSAAPQGEGSHDADASTPS